MGKKIPLYDIKSDAEIEDDIGFNFTEINEDFLIIIK